MEAEQPSADLTQMNEKMVAMNEALILGAVHQHELADAAESVRTQLQKTARELAEKARLLDLSKDAIIVRGFDDRITSWNKGAEQLYGWTAEEVIGKVLHSFLPTEFPKPLVEIEAELQREGNFTGEVVQIARDGRRIHSLCRWVLDRETESILTSYTDITERKQAEEALRASEERYRNLFNSMDEGYCIIEMVFDAQEKPVDWLFLEVNPSFEIQTGLRGAAGKRVRDLLPDHEEHWFQTYGKVALTGEPVRFVSEAKALGGLWFDLYAFRVGGTDSRKVAIIFTEISKRKKTEEELTSKARLLDLTHDAIFVRGMEGEVRYWNHGAEELYGWSREEALGQISHVLLKTEFPIPVEQMLEELRRTNHWVGELIHTKRDGQRITVLVRKTLDRDSEGNPVAVLESITDITARRGLEDMLAARAEDLARADRSKDEFLAMLAHELRNPLAPLRNAAQILQSTEATADERQQAQRIIGRQIENMSRMIDDLLDVSRITEGKIELRKQPVALEAILTAATSLVRSGCAARHQDLAVAMPTEPIFLNADATRLEQVFSNLLGNACKYSGHGCHISLSAERNDGIEPPEVIVRVRDDGAGIDPELLPRVFDLFVQATRALDRAHGGLGIGLTLVNRLVKLHGGSVEAHSEGLGHGSEFIVHLPILRQAPPPLAAPPPVARETPRRILIVDDNTDSARSMAILQTRRGHVTRIAFTGPDALAVAAEFLPEVVLLDIGLPGMDGFEVARRLRGMPALAGAFLIAMTGYASPEDLLAANEAGFDEHLVKPVDLDVLREWLRTRV
jgi:PAS domain S-box-containing protein